MTADGVHGFFGWCGFFGTHNWDGMHGDRDGKAPATAHKAPSTAHQVSRVRHADPTTVRTVAVQMAGHAPTLQPDRTAGRHRSDAQHRWTDQQTRAGSASGYQGRHQGGSFGGHHR